MVLGFKGGFISISQTAYVKNSKHACFGTQIGSELPKQNHLGHLKKKKRFLDSNPRGF